MCDAIKMIMAIINHKFCSLSSTSKTTTLCLYFIGWHLQYGDFLAIGYMFLLKSPLHIYIEHSDQHLHYERVTLEHHTTYIKCHLNIDYKWMQYNHFEY